MRWLSWDPTSATFSSCTLSLQCRSASIFRSRHGVPGPLRVTRGTGTRTITSTMTTTRNLALNLTRHPACASGSLDRSRILCFSTTSSRNGCSSASLTSSRSITSCKARRSSPNSQGLRLALMSWMTIFEWTFLGGICSNGATSPSCTRRGQSPHRFSRSHCCATSRLTSDREAGGGHSRRLGPNHALPATSASTVQPNPHCFFERVKGDPFVHRESGAQRP
mmetsp:Transcript_13009/g.41554  ORF Transcript_13009/g.41554 Transcript_13009/m.41554 type:complete len:222 (+) Transcript_13009:92-757(+)